MLVAVAFAVGIGRSVGPVAVASVSWKIGGVSELATVGSVLLSVVVATLVVSGSVPVVAGSAVV